MNKKLSYLILLFIMLFTCCSDDNDPKFKLDTEHIKQSSWSGDYVILVKSSNKIFHEYNLGITFYDELSGSYTLYSKDDGSVFNQNNFTYRINDKALIINNGLIAGDWFLLEQSNNKITLVHNLETGYYTDYIYLKKIY